MSNNSLLIVEYRGDKYKVQKMFTLYLKKILTYSETCSSVVSMKYFMVNMIFARNVENVVVAQDYFTTIFGKTEGNYQQN